MKSIKYWPSYRKLVRWLNLHFPEIVCKVRFRMLFGRKLDLKNPQDLNEKILWLSLYGDKRLWVRCADKYAVRCYVEEKGLGDILVKLYGKWDRVEDIEWNKLPKSFVLKSNNGAGTVLVVKDKSLIDIEETKDLLNRWLMLDVSGSTTEFHYGDIKPCIIAEETLEPTDADLAVSSSIIDYKIWCFNGKPDSVLVCSNRQPQGGCALSVYDLDWNYCPNASVFNDEHFEAPRPIPRPAKFKEMLEVAEKLSADFPEVRVDLYYINDRIYFGELTFTSLGGTMTYYTQQELLRMGQKIDLSAVKKIKK